MWRRVTVRPFKLGLTKRHYSKTPLSEAFQKGDEEDDAKQRYRLQKSPVIPSVQSIEKRWSTMDAGKQDDVIAYLEDKMRGNWNDMTLDEKKAAFYIWYGNWGPRSSKPTDMADVYLYFGGSIGLIVAGLSIYKYSTWDPAQVIEGIDYES